MVLHFLISIPIVALATFGLFHVSEMSAVQNGAEVASFFAARSIYLENSDQAQKNVETIQTAYVLSETDETTKEDKKSELEEEVRGFFGFPSRRPTETESTTETPPVLEVRGGGDEMAAVVQFSYRDVFPALPLRSDDAGASDPRILKGSTPIPPKERE